MVNPSLPVIRDCILIALGAVGVEVTNEAVLVNNQIDAPANIKVNAGSTAHVLSDEDVSYDLSGGGTVDPLPSDRAVWDALTYPTRHTNDTNIAAGIHHTLSGLDQRYLNIRALLVPPPRLDFMMQTDLHLLDRRYWRRGLPIINAPRLDFMTAGSALPVGVTSHVLTFNGTLNHWKSAAPSEPLLLEDGTVSVLENGHAAMSEPVFD